MKSEHSAGFIIRNAGKYLLLRYPKGYWDLPKGHIEKGESPMDAAIRELAEETGIQDIRIIDGFEERIAYAFNTGKERISKDVVFFLAETNESEVAISEEHAGFEWLAFDDAVKRLTYGNAKRILRAAHAFHKA